MISPPLRRPPVAIAPRGRASWRDRIGGVHGHPTADAVDGLALHAWQFRRRGLSVQWRADADRLYE